MNLKERSENYLALIGYRIYKIEAEKLEIKTMWDEEGWYEHVKCHGKRSIHNKSSFKNKKKRYEKWTNVLDYQFKKISKVRGK